MVRIEVPVPVKRRAPRQVPVKKLTDIDDAILTCRARGHKWPELYPGRPVPKSFHPVLTHDGCVLVTEYCERCGKERGSLTLPGGVFDRDVQRSYRNPPGWKVFKVEEGINRRDMEGEMYRRLSEEIMKTARRNALRREQNAERAE